MRKFRIFLIVAIVFLLSSCGSYKSVKVKNVNKASFEYLEQGIVKMNLTLLVDNPNSKFTLKEVNFNLLINDKTLGIITIEKPVKIHNGADQEISVVALLNPRGNVWQTIKTLSKLTKKTSSFVLDGDVKLSRGFVTKKIEVNKVPLKNFAQVISYNLDFPFMMALNN